ncbi:MAG TPA: HD domain-containing protein [Saprospiraceae bacterium]|nr:HD domain-containing protein [Saprospiraceae bacterium]HRV84084.1 HD domain-containing protein [Saprospiraceae bacterium]
MIFDIKPYERRIFELVQDAGSELGYEVYVVGGFVRDRLLGMESKDMDIVCLGSGIRLAEQVASKLSPTPKVVTFNRFGTAMIRHKNTEIEFVGARKESYRADSRKPIVEEGTLEDDQNRRDFTINALAVSLNERNFGEILDPFHGLQHLEEKRIKTPLEPGKTFSDDPLRMMRAIRFSCQLDFEIDPETYHAIGVYRNRINIVSKERITLELEKILSSSTPSQGFIKLFDTGLLEIIFPELTALHGVEIQKGIGHKDNFYHTLQVLDNVARKSSNIWLRWAALLHDIAKPPTKRFHPQAGWTFHGHEALGAAMVPRIFKRMRLPLDHKMKYVQKLVLLHLRPIALTKSEITDSAVRRLLFDAGEEIEDLLLLCEADITSKNEAKVRTYLQNIENLRDRLNSVEEKDRLRNFQPPVSGELIMQTFGIGPSREVGIIKAAIREAILEGEINNNYEEAFAYMMKEAEKLNLVPIS